MSDPMSNHQIEDVLSSIRRLVSDDLRPRTRAVPVPELVDKLLLTPALRIEPAAEPPARRLAEAVASWHDDAPAFEEAGAAEPDDLSPDGIRAADEAELAAWAARGPAAPAGGHAMPDPAPLATPEPAPAPDDPAGSSQPDAPAEPPAPHVGRSVVFRSRREREAARRQRAEAQAQPDLAETAAEPERPAEATDAPAAGGVMMPGPAALIEAAVAEAAEAAAVEAVGALAVGALAVGAAGTDAVDAQAVGGCHPEAEGPAPADAVAPEAVAHPATGESGAPDAGPGTALVPGGAVPARAGAPAGIIDEAALQDLIRMTIRAELQGPLGERITRNMRKLVRSELQRMLAARDLT